MGVIAKTKFSEISKSHYLFSTYNYFRLRKLIDAKLFFQQVRLGDYFEIISGYAFSSKDYTDEGISVCRIGDISKDNQLLIDEMLKLPAEYYDDFEKYRILKNDILIGLTGDGKFFKTCLVELEEPEILLNQRVGILRLKENIQNISVKFISLLFNTEEVQNQIRIVAMGKTQKNVSPFDILNIKIPKIDFGVQNSLIDKIIPIEIEINTLKLDSLKPVNIINQVFGEAFGFNWEEFEGVKQEKLYTSSILNFSNNIDCRFSYRFQHKSATYLHGFLENITNKRVKHFLDIPIVLGSSISPKQFDEEGEYYYISMATVKNYYFEKDDAQTVSEEYATNNLEKSVKLNDIIMTRSGVAIGKFALIEEDINGIFADFTMRIRLKGFNPELAYYYFRSEFFQHLITSHKKGLQNQNIFPSQIKEFPMPDWDETQQAEIVELIKTQLDQQKEVDRQIEEKQQAINKIIEDAIKQEQN